MDRRTLMAVVTVCALSLVMVPAVAAEDSDADGDSPLFSITWHDCNNKGVLRTTSYWGNLLNAPSANMLSVPSGHTFIGWRDLTNPSAGVMGSITMDYLMERYEATGWTSFNFYAVSQADSSEGSGSGSGSGLDFDYILVGGVLLVVVLSIAAYWFEHRYR